MSITKLPLYPGTRTRESLPPSQQAALNKTISATLHQILGLPHEKRDRTSSVAFVGSYAKDHAQRVLHALIWDHDTSGSSKRKRYTDGLTSVERTIHERTLRLAQTLATELPLETLIDLAVVYGLTNPKRFRTLLSSASKNQQLIKSIEENAIPAFSTLLTSTAQGLYGLRKISYILLSFIHTAPPELVRPFARNKEFVLSLANAYDGNLAGFARSYGGIRPERIDGSSAPLDDWEKIFLETKVALIDSFHVIMRVLLNDVEEIREPGSALAAKCEAAFDVVFGLLELPSSSSSQSSGDTATPIPFLNQSLLADYQHTYGLSRIIAEATRRADDARTELLESTLQSLDDGAGDGSSKPGALKLLLRSSGVQPGIDNLGSGKRSTRESPGDPDVKGKGKGKGKAGPSVEEVDDPVLDAAVAQVLDILPDTPPDYVRFLLSHSDYPFKGNAERLVEALFEGTAPSVDEVERMMAGVGDDQTDEGRVGVEVKAVEESKGKGKSEEFVYTKERRNVFDEEDMDITQLRVGKKRDEAQTVLQDRSYIEQMKADILRRAEEFSDEEEEEEEEGHDNKDNGIVVAYEDELDDGGLKVRDGNESEEGESEDDRDDEDTKPKTPETILELAYIANPKVFDRDAQTRRSKAREELRKQTGWADEQIEGWRIMLERNPNKDKILQKHEFSGNKRGPVPLPIGGPSQPPPGRGRGRGRGRGGGRGRGRGGHGGGGGGGNGGGDSTARDRAYKDKHKAQRGNHNRKRGHDKKMARAAGPS